LPTEKTITNDSENTNSLFVDNYSFGSFDTLLPYYGGMFSRCRSLENLRFRLSKMSVCRNRWSVG